MGKEKYKLIKFKDEDFELDVNVSPQEDTVWLSQEDLSILFNVNIPAINKHILNILKDGELDSSTISKMEKVQIEGDRRIVRQIKIYNLDMIISVGYRVKSQRGIVFRKWANNVLKQYLLKGYVVDENRAMVTIDNYNKLVEKVDNMDNKINKLDNRLSKLEFESILNCERVFFDGDFFDARVFLKRIICKAQSEIILVDPYTDIRALDYFKSNGRCLINLYISSKSNLTKDDIADYNQQYGNLNVHINNSFHDRFIILDRAILYHLGTSLNYMGKRTFAITEMNGEEFIPLIISRLEQ